MAFLVKNSNTIRTAGVAGVGQAFLDQHIHVARPGALLPQTTTEMLFRVRGGRVLVWLMLGEATVVLTATDPILSWNSTALSAASVAVGTTTVIASTVNLASLEVGGRAVIEGDGTAAVKSNAGASFLGIVNGWWVAPQGEIYQTSGANNTTGQIKWDLWYQPLDEGAYVEASLAGTAII